MLRLKGLIYLALTSMLIWHEYSGSHFDTWSYQLETWASTNKNLDMLVTIFLIVAGLFVIKFWFKGLSITCFTLFYGEEAYKQSPFGRKAIWNWSSATAHAFGSNSSDNVDKIKNYRNAKFSSMTNDEAADTYKKTAWVDSLGSTGKNTAKTRNYINAKLTTMDNDSALKWMKQ